MKKASGDIIILNLCNKKQNFEKMKRTPESIIILNMSTINENHMMYDSWDIVLDHLLTFYTLPSPAP